MRSLMFNSVDVGVEHAVVEDPRDVDPLAQQGRHGYAHNDPLAAREEMPEEEAAILIIASLLTRVC